MNLEGNQLASLLIFLQNQVQSRQTDVHLINNSCQLKPDVKRVKKQGQEVCKRLIMVMEHNTSTIARHNGRHFS